MTRPEREAAIAYLRRTGTDVSAARLLAGLRATFRNLERSLARVPEHLRTRNPTEAAWSAHEILDHLVETHGRAVAELRDLCEGVCPDGGPIPARLTSTSPLECPWSVLIARLKEIHADVLVAVASADDTKPLVARAPFVMVLKVATDSGMEVVEWVEALDWKAYAQAIRVHTHEHLAQVERTVAVSGEAGRPE